MTDAVHLDLIPSGGTPFVPDVLIHNNGQLGCGQVGDNSGMLLRLGRLYIAVMGVALPTKTGVYLQRCEKYGYGIMSMV